MRRSYKTKESKDKSKLKIDFNFYSSCITKTDYILQNKCYTSQHLINSKESECGGIRGGLEPNRTTRNGYLFVITPDSGFIRHTL